MVALGVLGVVHLFRSTDWHGRLPHTHESEACTGLGPFAIMERLHCRVQRVYQRHSVYLLDNRQKHDLDTCSSCHRTAQVELVLRRWPPVGGLHSI